MRSVLTLVTLGVADVSRARAFYTALGWRPAADSGVGQDTGGWGGITLAHNVGSPADVDAVLGQAREVGGRVVRAGAATEWGGYSGVFADPDEHRWEVAHNPFWPLAEDGRSVLPD